MIIIRNLVIIGPNRHQLDITIFGQKDHLTNDHSLNCVRAILIGFAITLPAWRQRPIHARCIRELDRSV